MSYQVLARKWRPRNFKEMAGQGHVLKTLINALDNKPVPLEMWKRQVDTAVARGWDIMIWTGYLTLDPIKPHIDYVAKWAQKGNE